jgi:hypothetical protein
MTPAKGHTKTLVGLGKHELINFHNTLVNEEVAFSEFYRWGSVST